MTARLKLLYYALRRRLHLLGRLAGAIQAAPGLWLLGRATPARPVRVSYGHDDLAEPSGHLSGGLVKFQRMQGLYPNSPDEFNILYLVSSGLPEDWPLPLWAARRQGARLIWNQNGVAYPACAPLTWRTLNARYRRGLRAARRVFYQSRFCKASADRWLGPPECPWEILYNAVDTSLFKPAPTRPEGPLTLLLGGSQYEAYRVETALAVLAELRRRGGEARLIVAGRVGWPGAERLGPQPGPALAERYGVAEAVEFTGPYSQAEAPALYGRADLLLHPVYNDASPGLVVEALACGLPVVHSASGGTPELVGEEAGMGIPAELSWERKLPPDPVALAEAVLTVAADLVRYARAARRRAVERFDLAPWLTRHQEVFEEMAGS